MQEFWFGVCFVLIPSTFLVAWLVWRAMLRDTYTFNFPGAPSEFVDAFRKYYGPTMNAFDAAEKNGRASDLQKELEDLFVRQNKGTNGNTSIPATFLQV